MLGRETLLEGMFVGSKIPADGQEFTLEMIRADSLALRVDPLGFIRECDFGNSKGWNLLMLMPSLHQAWPMVKKFRLIPHAMVVEDHKRVERWANEIGCRLASGQWLKSFRRSFPKPSSIRGGVAFGGKAYQWRNPEIGKGTWLPMLKPDLSGRSWISHLSTLSSVPFETRWLVEVL